LPKGRIEEKHEVKVTARDAAGNVDSDTGMVEFDTYVNRLESTSGKVAGDDIVNAAEASQGLSFSGVVEAGSTVMVKFEKTTREADVDAQGNWTVSFDASEIPTGTYESGVEITATDRAGNVATISDTFEVDTDIPDAPNTLGYWEDKAGGNINPDVSEVGIANTVESPDSVTLHQYVDGGDQAAQMRTTYDVVKNNEHVRYYFDDDKVSDGSHIVVTDTDAAGNSNSTLFAVDDVSSSKIDVTSGALDGFNIGAIDLDFAENSEITLSAADLEAMSDNDNILVIHGGSDDRITLTEDATNAGSTVIDGRTYDVYEVGTNGGQLILDEDILFNPNNPVM
ncbi:MAG: Ig-like domain-containing protein, partial [Paracoccaceae bacterium]